LRYLDKTTSTVVRPTQSPMSTLASSLLSIGLPCYLQEGQGFHSAVKQEISICSVQNWPEGALSSVAGSDFYVAA